MSLFSHSHHSMHKTAVSTGGAERYVCPMHPEVRQDHPGRCPKCKMHLVPEGEAGHGAAGAHHHGHQAPP